jgi:NADPH:quinone reductase-like Zn-dependent oxidoreductase
MACTVCRTLMDVWRLEAEESMLIHAGAGATGQMGIQLALYLAAEVYVTVGSERKKRLMVETYGVKEGNVFYNRDASFASAVKRVTGGRGVDFVLNILAGELLEVRW